MTIESAWPVSPGLGQRLALRRAERGTLYERDGAFFSAGRLAPPWLTPFLSMLLESGHLRLVARSYPMGVSVRVELSDAARVRLSELDHERLPNITTDHPHSTEVLTTTGERTTMWWHWALPALVAVAVVVRVIANLFDRPARDLPSQLREIVRQCRT